MTKLFTPKKYGKTLRGLFCLPVLLLAAAGAYAQAPNISYSSPQVYTALTTITPLKAVNTGGAVPVPKPVLVSHTSNAPYGFAIDAAGNFYVASKSANDVEEIPAGGGAAIILASGFNQPTGVAVDTSGNVYVADSGNDAIKEIPAGGGTVITLGSGFKQPYGIALDAAGNIYVSDTGNNLIKKMPAGGGTPVAFASGFAGLSAIAVDTAGNVYVNDHGAIKKIPAGGGSTITLATENIHTLGIAVDAAGNVYCADPNNDVITEIAAGGGASISLAFAIYPLDLAFGPSGKLYMTDGASEAIFLVNPGNYSISPAIPAGLIFDSNTGNIKGTPIISSPATDYHVTTFNSSGSSMATVNITVLPSNQLSSLKLSAGKLSPSFGSKVTNYRAGEANTVTSITVTPTAIEAGATIQVNGSVVTSGTASPGLPLNVGDNIITVLVTAQDGATHKTYTVNAARYQAQPVLSYSVPQVDTVGVAISPLGPAARSGVGPFGFRNSPVTLGSGFSGARDVAIDAAGNVYVADADAAVKELPAAGGSIITLASGLVATGVAVDAFGNIYVLDYDNSIDYAASIKEIPVGGGPVIALTSDMFRPDDAIASDAAGNVYVAQSRLDVITKIPAGGGAPVAVGSGFHAPSGVAADAFGNVYVADGLNNKIKKILATDGSTVTLANGHGAPWGVAVDALGNVYFTESSKSAIYEIPVGGGPQFAINPGFKYPGRLAIDPTGKIDATDLSTVKQLAPAGGYFINAALPAGLTFDENTGIFSGTPTVVSPATNYTVTAYNGGGSGSATVNIKTVAKGEQLTSLVVAGAALSPKFAADTLNYVASVPLSTTSTIITPTTADAGATITVNGVMVTSGTASAPIPLSPGDNTITTVVTASGGAPQTTYTVVVTRAALSNADLSGLAINEGTLSPAFDAGTTDYTAAVLYGITSVRVTPVTSDSHATVTVNGTTVASGAKSPAFPLIVGDNTLSVIVRNGTTAKTYTITLTREQSANAYLTNLSLDYGRYALSPSFAYTTNGYAASVTNDVTAVNVIPAIFDPNATVTVNGASVLSGAAKHVLLSVGSNIINTTVTAHDGVTTNTYTIDVTRAAPGGLSGRYESVSVVNPVESLQIANDDIAVRPGLSPNGDGNNDFLIIDGIAAHPENKLQIISRDGRLVYEAKGYDNASKVFDGHSNKTGALQSPGTYFYSLDYTVKGIAKRKTGFIVLKY